MLVQTKIAWDGQVVQQLYSNPSKPPETVGNTATQQFAAILQILESSGKLSHRLCTAEGVGSNPIGSTLKGGVLQVQR
jgi:hypothetical protein